jgi:hypothetical protein
MSRKILILLCCFLFSGCVKQINKDQEVNIIHSWAFKVTKAAKYPTPQDYSRQLFEHEKKITEEKKINLLPINRPTFLGSLVKDVISVGLVVGAGVLGATNPSSLGASVTATGDTLVMMDTLSRFDQANKDVSINKKKKYFGATLFAWMPENFAANATEARAKLAVILEQAFYNATREDVKPQQKKHWRLFDYFNPHEVTAFSLPVKQQIPDIVANATGLSGDAWVWNFKDSPILFYLCNIINHAHSQYVQVEYDDLSFYSKVSRLLPKWCFIYLPFKYNSRWFARLHSDGEKFLLMPRLLWQGKSHFFIAKPAKHKQQTQAAQ